MPVLPVRIKGQGLESEWALLELQGTIDKEAHDSFDGMKLGELSFSGKKPILVIGNKRMEGKRVGLDKPLAVLRKTGGEAAGAAAPAEPMVVEDSTGAGDMAYEVLGQIKSKLVFKLRPQPILRSAA